MIRRTRVASFASAAGVMTLATSIICANPADATLTLTVAGVNDGFTLATFATMDPGNTGCCGGPFGIAVSGGNVIVSNGFNNSLSVFADVDGQTSNFGIPPTSALFNIPGAGTGVTAMATVSGVAYGRDPATNLFAQYNGDGTINHDLTGVSAHVFLGMWGAPNGHIIASSQDFGLIDINPTDNGGLGSFRVINSTLFPDGVSVSPDGKTAYIEESGIHAVDIATGLLGPLYPSSGAADGSGVISGGAFNGFVIANTNFGNIDLIDPMTNTFTTIATGGTRGDYTSPDPNNGSLFLAYSDIVARLTCPNCSFTPLPEPASLVLLAAGLLGMAFFRRRRRDQVADGSGRRSSRG